jgi:hypothetical protein
MRFGEVIAIRRGGHPPENGLAGSHRTVQVRYLGARGHQVYGELLADDPLAIVGKAKGERLWWSRSVVLEHGGK